MEQSIRQRIDSLRAFMADHKLGAFIIPSSDPHQSEYVAPYWETRKWLSGFTGSAGTLVVTTHEAGLWTDSRYFLQAAEQLEGSGIDLYKDGLPETPDIASFLKSRMPMEAVGIDGSVFSASAALQLKKDWKATPKCDVLTTRGNRCGPTARQCPKVTSSSIRCNTPERVVPTNWPPSGKPCNKTAPTAC